MPDLRIEIDVADYYRLPVAVQSLFSRYVGPVYPVGGVIRCEMSQAAWCDLQREMEAEGHVGR